MPHTKYIPIILLLNLLISASFPFFLIFFVVPLLIYRWTLSKLYRYLNPNSTGMLGTQSVFYCHLVREVAGKGWTMVNSSQCTVMLLVSIEGAKLDLSDFRGRVTREVVCAKKGPDRLLYPEFQQYPVWWNGYMFWKKDTSFAIENHIKLYENEKDWYKRDKNFCQKFVRQYQNTVTPSDRSPWEIMLLENVRQDPDDEATTLLVFKFPHYFADGYSIFNVLTRLADGGSGSVVRHDPKPPTRLENFLFWTTYPFRASFEMLALLTATLEAEKPARTTSPSPQTTAADRDVEEGPQTNDHLSFFSSNSIPAFQVLRNEAKRLGVSFTAILVGCIGQTMGKSLNRGSAFMSAGLMLPSPAHREGLTNNFRTTVLHVPANTDQNFADRVQDLERQLLSVKKSTAPTTAVLIWRLFGAMPTTWSWKYTLFKLGIRHDIFLSVFPGPKEEFSVLGRKVTAMNFVVHPGLLPFPLALSILTYNGKIQFWLTAPTDLMSPELVHELGECIEREFSLQTTPVPLTPGVIRANRI